MNTDKRSLIFSPYRYSKGAAMSLVSFSWSYSTIGSRGSRKFPQTNSYPTKNKPQTHNMALRTSTNRDVTDFHGHVTTLRHTCRHELVFLMKLFSRPNWERSANVDLYFSSRVPQLFFIIKLHQLMSCIRQLSKNPQASVY